MSSTSVSREPASEARELIRSHEYEIASLEPAAGLRKPTVKRFVRNLFFSTVELGGAPGASDRALESALVDLLLETRAPVNELSTGDPTANQRTRNVSSLEPAARAETRLRTVLWLIRTKPEHALTDALVEEAFPPGLADALRRMHELAEVAESESKATSCATGLDSTDSEASIPLSLGDVAFPKTGNREPEEKNRIVREIWNKRRGLEFTVQGLCSELGCSRTTAQRVIDRLCEFGAVRAGQGKRGRGPQVWIRTDT